MNLTFLIYIVSLYILLTFLWRSSFAFKILVKFRIGGLFKKGEKIFKTNTNPIFSFLVFVTATWFYFKNLDAAYLSTLLFLFTISLLPILFEHLEKKYKISISKPLHIFILAALLLLQFATYWYVNNKKDQLSNLNVIIQNKSEVISSIRYLSKKNLSLSQIDSVWLSIKKNSEHASDTLSVGLTIYSRLLNDALISINYLDYSNAINSLNYLINHGFANGEVYYLLGNSYLFSNNKIDAFRSYKNSANFGNVRAAEIYEKLNPLKKRISYYVTLCCDGTISYSTGRGTCSWHGGVCQWNYPIYENYRDF